MTLQGLSKYLDKYDVRVVDSDSSNSSFESLKGLPFYNWSGQQNAMTPAKQYNTTVNDSSLLRIYAQKWNY
jgi:hypothetical protein